MSQIQSISQSHKARSHKSIRIKNLSELIWNPDGYASFSGSLLELHNKIDRLILSWASNLKAEEWYFPPFLASKNMQKIGYFKSFPQLVTLPVTLNLDQKNVDEYLEKLCDKNGQIINSEFEPIKHVLTPAACYHFYHAFENRNFSQTKIFTTRANCFRNEKSYEPLVRQWSFRMREIVCIGSQDEVRDFLTYFENLLQNYFAACSLDLKIQYASDPFFKPEKNAKALMQKLAPVKKEVVYDDRIPIVSLNFHRNFFGETYNITKNGEAIYSACVAFGLERWMYMLLQEQGLTENFWSN